MKKSLWIKIVTSLIILSFILSYFFVTSVHSNVNQIFTLLKMNNIHVIKGYIQSFGIWAPVISFLLMIVQSVAAPIPAILITFSNAAIFGWVKGAILSWTSAMAGAVLCFYIARIYGKDLVGKLTSKFALEEIDGFFEKHGKYAILIARLLPFISFDIVSYAAGATSISFWSFFWATGIGQLPATIIYSYVGEMLIGSVKMFMIGLSILFALSVLIFLLKKIWNEKNRTE